MLNPVFSISTTGLFRCLHVFSLLKVLLWVMTRAAARGRGPVKGKTRNGFSEWQWEVGSVQQESLVIIADIWEVDKDNLISGAFGGAEQIEVLKNQAWSGQHHSASHTPWPGITPRTAAQAGSYLLNQPVGTRTSCVRYRTMALCTKTPTSWHNCLCEANGESLIWNCQAGLPGRVCQLPAGVKTKLLTSWQKTYYQATGRKGQV